MQGNVNFDRIAMLIVGLPETRIAPECSAKYPTRAALVVPFVILFDLMAVQLWCPTDAI
jgi:hypothetical protein